MDQMDDRFGLYINTENGNLIFQYTKYGSINFGDIGEVEEFSGRLAQSLDHFKSKSPTNEILVDADATSAVAEAERIICGAGIFGLESELQDKNDGLVPSRGGETSDGPPAPYYVLIRLKGIRARSKRNVMRAVSRLTGKTLAGTKEDMETLPMVVTSTSEIPKAVDIRNNLEAVGGLVEMIAIQTLSETDV